MNFCILKTWRFVSNQVYEYILFAGLLMLATVVFVTLAYFYEYTPESHLKSSFVLLDPFSIFSVS